MCAARQGVVGALIIFQLLWLVRQLVRSGSTVWAFVTNSWNAVEIFALVLCAVVVFIDAMAVWSGQEVRLRGLSCLFWPTSLHPGFPCSLFHPPLPPPPPGAVASPRPSPPRPSNTSSRG